MYRASINITPTAPQRHKTHIEEAKGEEEEKEQEGGGQGGGVKTPEVEGAVGGDLQQLIRQVTVSTFTLIKTDTSFITVLSNLNPCVQRKHINTDD